MRSLMKLLGSTMMLQMKQSFARPMFRFCLILNPIANTIFLYELFYHDFLKDKIKNMLSKNFNDYQFYDSFLIELTPEEFSEIKYLFDQDSELEQTKKYDEMNRMLLFLNTSVKIAQKDTKMWEV